MLLQFFDQYKLPKQRTSQDKVINNEGNKLLIFVNQIIYLFSMEDAELIKTGML